MAEAKRLYSAPTKPYDMLYVCPDRFPGTPTHPQPAWAGPETPKDVYQAALVFAAAEAMYTNYPAPGPTPGAGIKVALLGDAVLAVDPGFLSLTPEPPHPSRTALDKQINKILAKGVEIWF